MNFFNIRNWILIKLGRAPELKPNICYGQDGEDLILKRLLGSKKRGFYVDVGAHHPIRFSNTYCFYKQGWRGINVDAMPGSMIEFNRLRSRDINIECGVGTASDALSYYRFNEPALNTFNLVEAKQKNTGTYQLLDSIPVRVERLDTLLDRHLPVGQEIDFFSIDAEGNDYEVLQSNNWERYRPRFIVIETLRTDLLGLNKCPITQLLLSVGYKPTSKVYNTTFFAREDCMDN